MDICHSPFVGEIISYVTHLGQHHFQRHSYTIKVSERTIKENILNPSLRVRNRWPAIKMATSCLMFSDLLLSSVDERRTRITAHIGSVTEKKGLTREEKPGRALKRCVRPVCLPPSQCPAGGQQQQPGGSLTVPSTGRQLRPVPANEKEPTGWQATLHLTVDCR